MLMTRRPYKTIIYQYCKPTKVKTIVVPEIRITNVLSSLSINTDTDTDTDL